jgi:hypothetical protein
MPDCSPLASGIYLERQDIETSRTETSFNVRIKPLMALEAHRSADLRANTDEALYSLLRTICQFARPLIRCRSQDKPGWDSQISLERQ